MFTIINILAGFKIENFYNVQTIPFIIEVFLALVPLSAKYVVNENWPRFELYQQRPTNIIIRNFFYDFSFQESQARSFDDLDLEQVLKNEDLSTPDVIKSALDHKSEGSKISETTIDRLFGAPDKIIIPERYIPDTVNILLNKSLKDSF